MKFIFIVIALLASGCASKMPRSSQNPNLDFVLHGVLREGVQSRQFPITISQAIQQAGGLRNCPDCYKSGGEALLWEAVGPAKIRRGDSTMDVKSEDFGSFGIEPNDLVYISHKLL